MRLDELELLCAEAARGLVEREGRPLPAAVVLPLPAATRVLTFPEFPDDDADRFDLLARFAADVMRPENAPCYGFVAEAQLDQYAGGPVRGEGAGAAVDVGEGAGGAVDVVVVVYGARRNHSRVMAAPLGAEGMGAFTQAEELDPAAMPFLRPLQHAADAAASASEEPPGTTPGWPLGPPGATPPR